MTLLRLSALGSVRFYSTGNTHGHSAAGRMKLMKNPSDISVNRTRNLPACSAVPKPTEPLLTESPRQINLQLNYVPTVTL
jgi:hypothetical protein